MITHQLFFADIELLNCPYVIAYLLVTFVYYWLFLLPNSSKRNGLNDKRYLTRNYSVNNVLM